MLKERKISKIFSSKRMRTYVCVTYVYECDECKEEFLRKQRNKRPLHFCTRDCYQNSMKCGIANDFVKSKMTDDVKEKIKLTTLERFGVASFFSIPEVQEKAKQTCIERYGTSSSMGNSDVRSKKEATFFENYGTTVPIVNCASVISKSIQTQLEKYGCLYQQTDEYKIRVKQTNNLRFGYDHPMKSEEFKKQFDFQAAWRKQHETKKKNGTYASSQIEKQFGILLKNTFGENNVQQQIIVNGWIIDFFIENIQTYVQFDGVYWHGLDRKIDEIQLSTKHRDMAIFAGFKKDREQEKWFLEQSLRLVRVTDQEFKNSPEETLKKVMK